MKHQDLSYLAGTLVSEASGPLSAVIICLRETRPSRLLGALALAVMTLGILIPSYGQGTNVFNCSGFVPSGTCGVGFPGGGPNTFVVFGSTNGSTPVLSGSEVNLAPAGAVHTAINLNYYQASVNVQAFTSTFTYVPNGWNIAFILNNTTNNPNFEGPSFSGGAGCEGSIFQGFNTSAPPNNIFALQLDQQSALTDGNGTGYGTPFTYSAVQFYQAFGSPCNPVDGNPNWYYFTRKVSTSPVPLNSPANGAGTTTGDTYSATVIYTGTNLTLQLYDLTKGGSCPGSSCFTYTWNNVYVPSMVDGTTAYVGLGESTNTASSYPLYVKSFAYNVLSPAAKPTLSPNPGIYAGTQSVTISDPSSGAIICYDTIGMPATNGTTGCAIGTLYTGAISVPSGRTIYAVAGGTGYGDSAISSGAYNITGTASQPTYTADSGAYQGAQTVILTAAHGEVICYNTTGAPSTNGSTGCTTGTPYTAPITVSSNETLYSVAGGTGLTDSAVSSAAYTISQFWGGFPDSTDPPNSPQFSPLPGTYSSAQSVTLSSSTPGSYICYLLSATTPPILPYPDSAGGCPVGTLYTGPVPVQSSETLYAIAAAVHTSPPSTPTAGTYTIGPTPAPPTNPAYSVTP